VTFALGLLVASLLAPLLGGAGHRRWALRIASVLVLLGLAHDAAPVVDLKAIGRVLDRLDPLAIGAVDGAGRLLLVAALVWCGPAADLLVRRVLDATGLPAPEAAAAAGLGAGRWIGRLERWVLVVCVAAGLPALAVIPIGGKALFRYAEVVADARAEQPRLTGPDGNGPDVTRDALVDYVIVGSLASWTQAIALGVVVAGAGA
jgi:hypothetical protein